MRTIVRWIIYACILVAGVFAAAIALANIYKDEILAKINERLQETVNGDVRIEDYNVTFFHKFPHLSITLYDIYLNGPKFEVSNRPFLKAERIDINLQWYKLLTREVSIHSVDIVNGDLFVFRTADGYTNADVFKTRRISATASNDELVVIDLKQISLRDIRVEYKDDLKKKQFGVTFVRTQNRLSKLANGSAIQVTGNVIFKELLLNPAKGSFLRNRSARINLSLELDSTRKHLALIPSQLVFDKSTVSLSGFFELNSTGKFQLKIGSDKMDYREAVAILADSISAKLGRFDVEKPVKVDVNIDGRLEPGVKPAVDVAFSFKDSKVNTGNIGISEASVSGTFINHANPQLPNAESNSRLHFSTLVGQINGLPVDAVLTLEDMLDPSLDLKAKFSADLKALNTNLDSTRLRLIDGTFVSNFSYTGKLNEYLDDTRTSYEGKLNGEARITNASFHYNQRQVRVEKMNAVMRFTQDQLDIAKLDFVMNKNQINVKGVVKDFIPFFINPATSGKVQLAISSPKLDITGMLRQRAGTSARAKSRSKKRMSDMVERLSNELDFDLDFDVRQFVNAKFKASRLRGKLILANDQLVIANAGMSFGGGLVKMDMKVKHLSRQLSPVEITATVKDVGLKQFFLGFNNFNQTTFRHEHIDGKLNLDVNLQSQINNKFDLLTDNLKGSARFNIRDGSLKNFEPMQRLSNFLLKGRDFSDVRFSDVGTQIVFNGTQMEVSRMEIESTVLTMFIEGTYDMKDNTDLSVQVPLSNLKKRSQEFAPENIGVDTKVGASVFLRVKPDKDGKAAISYDPFKRLRKKNRKGT